MVTATEITCELSLSATEQNRLIEFSENHVKIWNSNKDGFEIYDSIGAHRFMRIKNADRPIVIVFSLEGYVLEVYDIGVDLNTDSPCGNFTFTSVD
jgi:hypothetical protein